MKDAPNSRGFRFFHPDLDEPPAGLRVGPGGAPELVDGVEAVRQAVLLLLSTTPGERVMRPDYGCDLHRLLFAPNDDTTAGLAIHYVRRALERWEPRIAVLRVDADRDPDQPGVLEVSVDYKVRAAQRRDQVVVSLQLTEGAPG
jgi:phage baseplate assembly protein W